MYLQSFVLHAMHDEAQTLLNVMNVFITEPLLDWAKPAGIGFPHAHWT